MDSDRMDSENNLDFQEEDLGDLSVVNHCLIRMAKISRKKVEGLEKTVKDITPERKTVSPQEQMLMRTVSKSMFRDFQIMIEADTNNYTKRIRSCVLN